MRFPVTVSWNESIHLPADWGSIGSRLSQSDPRGSYDANPGNAIQGRAECELGNFDLVRRENCAVLSAQVVPQ